jgi:hypothetical protein
MKGLHTLDIVLCAMNFNCLTNGLYNSYEHQLKV